MSVKKTENDSLCGTAVGTNEQKMRGQMRTVTELVMWSSIGIGKYCMVIFSTIGIGRYLLFSLVQALKQS